MTKRTSAKYKIDRRMGENIWGRPKSPVNRREYGPGQHGQRRKGKMSDFGTQLRAKQKLKGYYGDLTEKQFRRDLRRGRAGMRGDTSENLIGLLERRLDAVVYRAKFVPTMFAARQFVNHGHVMVNGRRVNIASYRVKEGDVVQVRDKSRQMALVLEALGSPERDVPEYLAVDHSKMTAEFVRTPAPHRRALSGDDGTEPGRRILRQELIRSAQSDRGAARDPRGPSSFAPAAERGAPAHGHELSEPRPHRRPGRDHRLRLDRPGHAAADRAALHLRPAPGARHRALGRAPHLPRAARRALHPPPRSPARTTGRC